MTPKEICFQSSKTFSHAGLQNRQHPNIEEFDRDDSDECTSLSRKRNKFPAKLPRKISRNRLHSNDTQDGDSGVENVTPIFASEPSPTILAPVIHNTSTAPSLLNPRNMKKSSSMRSINRYEYFYICLVVNNDLKLQAVNAKTSKPL